MLPWLEHLRLVEDADGDVDLARQPLILVEKRGPAVAAEGPPHSGRGLENLRRPRTRSHVLPPVCDEERNRRAARLAAVSAVTIDYGVWFAARCYPHGPAPAAAPVSHPPIRDRTYLTAAAYPNAPIPATTASTAGDTTE